MLGSWVRIRGYTPTGIQTLWIGRIENEVREPQGPVDVSSVLYPAGKQTWVAYELAHFLDKITVARSVWLRPKLSYEAQDPDVLTGFVEQTLEWVPTVNARDSRNLVGGNARRQVDAVNGDKVRFGGTDFWSGFADAQYLLDQFVNGDVEGPTWRLGGQAALLSSMEGIIRTASSESVLSILKRIISADYGIDAVIVPIAAYEPVVEGPPADTEEEGFEIYVFALSGTEQSYGGVTLPVNPRTMELRRSTQKDAPLVKISRAGEHSVGRVELFGARMVCCVTLENQIGNEDKQDLAALWTDALEGQYAAGTGNAADTPEEHDKARGADKLRPVFRNYGAPPAWDRWKALTAPVVLLNEATLELQQTSGEGAPFQSDVRETLTFLPFKTGVNYSNDPPVDSLSGDPRDPYLSPQAWIVDEERIADQQAPPAELYIAADQAGMNVSALLDEWGLAVAAHPPHLLGLNHFEFPPVPYVGNDSALDPLYDWTTM